MRIRSKVVLFSLLFALASGAVMTWCFVNIRREEAAFVNSRRAIKTFAAVTDIEYFFVRQVRLLESYVLLADESEKLQLVQAFAQTRQRMEEWRGAVKKGEALGEEIPSVQSVSDAISVPANKIRGLIAQGKRTKAMELVENEFSPASARALVKYGAVKRRAEAAKANSERLVISELQRSHLGLMGGLGLILFFGLTFLFALYGAVIRPIQKMKAWADRVARGEKGAAMTAFSGQNELTELARSLGEMAIQLTRPKASPPPLKTHISPPPAPLPPAVKQQVPLSPVVPPVAAPVHVPAPSVPQGEAIPIPEVPEKPFEVTRFPETGPSLPPPPQKDDFEEAVNDFRHILTLMGQKETPKPHK